MSGATLEAIALSLADLHAKVDRLLAERQSAPAPRATNANAGGVTFPNYGRSKGALVAGATMQDLEYYATGARRTLADPAKSRWHDKERALLAAIEAEIARQGGGATTSTPAPDFAPGDDDGIPF